MRQVALATALVYGWPTAAQMYAQAAPTGARVNIDYQAANVRHPITLDDILSIRETVETILSPDARWVAFVVRQAFRDCNCYRSALYIAPAGVRGTYTSRAPRKLVEEEAIWNLRWIPSEAFVSYLVVYNGKRELWRISPSTGLRERILAHFARGGSSLLDPDADKAPATQGDLEQYEWSPNGSQVAFTTRPVTDSAALRRVVESGVVYDDERMWGVDIIRRQWTREPSEVWVYDLQSRSERLLWRVPSADAMSVSRGVSNLVWDPAGDRIAVSYPVGSNAVTGERNHDLAIIDVVNHRFRPLVTTESSYEESPIWSADGQQLAFTSRSIDPVDLVGSSSALGIINITTGEVSYLLKGRGAPLRLLRWSADGKSLEFEGRRINSQQERSGVYQVDMGSAELRRLTPAENYVSSCSAAVRGQTACVRESSNVPPEPVLVQLSSGDIRLVAVVNPELRSVILGPVTELRWTNHFGRETNGYLVRPYQYSPARRYPLVVILYGFEGRFVAAAEWIRSYPAQALAREGFLVLLCNAPDRQDLAPSTFESRAREQGYGPLSSLESAVDLLARQGLADTSRVGIMGWSMGGFWTEFALTHSSLFRVASIGNAGDYNPGAYWYFGQHAYRTFTERLYGGAPYPPILSRWLAFAPALNARRVQAPVLLEAQTDEAILALEMFSALRHYRVPVELVVYPDEGHVFMQPLHRIVSMQRNLDWFRFWLLGKENPDPREKPQYLRWRTMRDQLKNVRSGSPDVPPTQK